MLSSELNILHGILERDNLAFLVGAGISLDSPSNMLRGGAFISAVLKEIAPTEAVREQLEALCWTENPDRSNPGDFLRFEGLMGILTQSVDEELHVLDCLADCDAPNTAHYVLAYLMGKGHTVFTVNFDALIEQACSELDVAYTAFVFDEEFEVGVDGTAPLFKLHGSMRRYDGVEWQCTRKSIQATLDTVGSGGDEAVSLTVGKRAVFEQVLQEKDLVVLGYSGYDDFDICPALKQVRTDKELCWINHSSRPRYRPWDELAASPRDKAGALLQKEVEHLLKMGSNGVRKPARIHLFDIDTNDVIGTLRQHHGIEIPRPSAEHEFDREAFFRDWGKTHIPDVANKYLLCAAVFYSLGEYKHAEDAYLAARKEFVAVGDIGNECHSRVGLASIYSDRGDYRLALEEFEQVKLVSEANNNNHWVANMLIEIGLVHQRMGELEPARQSIQSALVTIEGPDEADRASNAQVILGIIYLEQENLAHARRHIERALQLAQSASIKKGIAGASHELGILSIKEKRYKEALQSFILARSTFEKLGNRRAIGRSRHEIGNVYMCLEEFTEALESYQHAREMFTMIGDMDGLAGSTGQLGKVLVELGKFDEASTMFEQSLRLWRELDNDLWELRSLWDLQVAYGKSGAKDLAGRIHAEWWETKQRPRSGVEEIVALDKAGLVHYKAGRWDEALQYFMRANKRSIKLQDRAKQAVCLFRIGRVRMEKHEFAAAIRSLELGVSIDRELERTAEIASGLQQIGLAKYRLGQADEGLEALKESLVAWQSLGRVAEIADVSGLIGDALGEAGNIAEAAKYLCRASVFFRQGDSSIRKRTDEWMERLGASVPDAELTRLKDEARQDLLNFKR